jgi:hypothetical protein
MFIKPIYQHYVNIYIEDFNPLGRVFGLSDPIIVKIQPREQIDAAIP